MSVIKVRNLKKKFDSEYALDGINAEFLPGKIYGLLGPNASGKTTLIKMINGLLIPTDGSVVIDGNKPGAESKKIISYMPDRFNMIMTYKVSKTLDLMKMFFDDFNYEKATELLELFHIDKDKKINALSKGTVEKLQLVLTISRDAQIYILDEPLGGVDPAARDHILDVIIEKFNPNATMIISTHLIADVERVLDEIVFIKAGKIILNASADSVRDKHNKSIDQLFREMFRV